MKALFLSAMDVWLFRDGRPFNANGDHRAESLFPPHPSVIQGALRSYYLSLDKSLQYENADAVIKRVGTAQQGPDGFSLRGPYLARRENDYLIRYYPQPADAVSVPGARHTIRSAAVPQGQPDGLRTNSPTPDLLGLADPLEKGETGLWLSEKALDAYLRGQTVQGVPAGDLFQRQAYPGIGLQNDHRVTKDGALFEVEYIRPGDDVGLYVEMDGWDDWPEQGALQLGGEHRAASFTTVKPLPWPTPPTPLPPKFKVYFATPAYFEAGWIPNNWEDFFDGKVELIAAAVGRYDWLGGYDYAAQIHKPARRYVPAGSVYYFKTSGASWRKDRPFAMTQDGQQFGYGQILIKGW